MASVMKPNKLEYPKVNLYYLVNQNLKRNPKRTSRGAWNNQD